VCVRERERERKGYTYTHANRPAHTLYISPSLTRTHTHPNKYTRMQHEDGAGLHFPGVEFEKETEKG